MMPFDKHNPAQRRALFAKDPKMARAYGKHGKGHKGKAYKSAMRKMRS